MPWHAPLAVAGWRVQEHLRAVFELSMADFQRECVIRRITEDNRRGAQTVEIKRKGGCPSPTPSYHAKSVACWCRPLVADPAEGEAAADGLQAAHCVGFVRSQQWRCKWWVYHNNVVQRNRSRENERGCNRLHVETRTCQYATHKHKNKHLMLLLLRIRVCCW